MHRIGPSHRSRAGLGLVLGLVLGLQLFTAATAHAIPVQGDYVFTSGLSGTFSSDGSKLTAWNIIDPNAITWANTNLTQTVVFNDSSYLGLQSGTAAQILLDWGRAHVNGNAGRQFFSNNFSFIVAPPTAVPEPRSGSLLALGLLALLGYGWRQRRQAGLQIG